MKAHLVSLILLLTCASALRAVDETSAIPFSELGAKATADYKGDAIGISASADGVQLRTGFQKLTGTVTSAGLALQSTDVEGGGLRLWASEIERGAAGERITLPTTGTVAVGEKTVTWARPGLVEEYSVSVDGVRQDFIVAERLEGEGKLSVELALSGATVETAVDGVKLTLTDSRRLLAYHRLNVTDATGRVLSATLAVLSPSRLAVRVDDAGAAYPVRIDPTFSDADWVSLNASIPGVVSGNSAVQAVAVDGSGNLYVGGFFIVAGSVAASNIAKWDGTSWTALGTGVNGSVNALVVIGTNLYAGGDFTLAGGVANTSRIAKWDGSAWSALGTGMNQGVNALAVIGTDLYAGGNFTTTQGGVANSLLRIAKWNGSAWSALGTGINGRVDALAVDSSSNLYAAGDYAAAGGVASTLRIARWNGSAWSALGTGITGGAVHALAASGTDIYATGAFTAAGGVANTLRIAKWSGSAWSALGTGINGTGRALAASGTDLYAGGEFTSADGVANTSRIAKWSGSAWSALGTGMNDTVNSLLLSGTDVFSGGRFTVASGVGVSRIAKWNGSAWSAFGTGMNNAPSAFAVSGTDLYVGGFFNSVGGVANTAFIAKWDGSAWSSLGTGMDNGVSALAVSGTDLYAGGSFTTAGGVSASRIAKWDGSAWSALGTGMNGDVRALAVIGTDLYAGGSFTSAGGVADTNRIAKWDGSSWSALGTGMDGNVFALAVIGTDLYAGGFFTTTQGGTANAFLRIAKWDGSAWSALGTGMNNFVIALAVSGTDLYAGGAFLSAGGVANTSRIAKWNGSAWSALGTGIDFLVGALAVRGTDLYAGGGFTMAGGVPVSRLAKWDGSAWSALGTGVDNSVTALAINASGNLIIGGSFTFVGTTTVSPFLVQATLPPTALAPTVTAISPTSGSTAGGSSVTITGTDFTGATAVTIGGTAATLGANTGTTLTVTTGARAAGTGLSVEVTTPGGTNAPNTLFTYIAPPTVASLDITSGSTLGGVGVTITGTGFTGTTTVTIGGVVAASFTVVNDTTITAITPPGTSGSVSVVVTTTGGSNAANTLYTYTAPTVQDGPPFAEFVDPNPNAGNQFGATVVALSTGNVVITSPFDDAGGTDAGAVYLFNGATGALISTLRGSTANDNVGRNGVTALSNGNYVVISSRWDNGAATNAGAVTWGSGTSGVSGVVSASNSLVGTQTNDSIGNRGVTALSSGNYVVGSPNWDNSAAVDAGAVTWGSGTSGVSGAVSSSNSLVGTTDEDSVGDENLTLLSNGNYVVCSPYWDNDAMVDAGAVTWGSGSSGVSGVISASNSLVGSTENSQVGGGGVTALSNGNYVVASDNWINDTFAVVGAVTWGSGTSGVRGAISSSNSLVGTTDNDQVGNDGVTALSNGNYVVATGSWSNGASTNVGAVTWGSGISGVSGAVSSSNSLVGTTDDDQVGSGGVTALSNGNYVVVSEYWDDGSAVDVGAVTLCSGISGVNGVVSSSNSLLGSTDEDFAGSGGVTALSNGNYVVSSPNWDNGSSVDVGAVTWGSGTSGVSGAISISNSLFGTTSGDQVGDLEVTTLSNGNYVVRSPNWDNGAVADAGAVTWGSGTAGVSGAVSNSNSLVGTTANDNVGSGGVTALSNGNYVVASHDWDNGAVMNAGAATWGSGTSGVSGAVSSSNSLVGTTNNDFVSGYYVIALSNGNYVVASQNWNNGALGSAGAVTWGSGTSGVSGAVSSSNSLVGATAGDSVGAGGVTELSNGNYVVRAPYWDNGAAFDAGAVIWCSGTTGGSGTVSASNSLVGLTSNATLLTVVADNVNGTYFVRFLQEGSGKVRLGSQADGLASTPAPTVTAISPTSGSTDGGTIVTITGTNFINASAVTIGGTAAPTFTVDSATQITATTPAGSAGTASVLVTTPGGTNAANSLYTYIAPEPLAALQAYLKSNNSEAGDRFGYSVAVSGDTAVVGAYQEDSNATGIGGNGANNSVSASGAAYVFTRSGSTWTQQAYLKASNPEVSDYFGYSVAVSGDTIVIGAYLEDSSATGVGGNQADNSAPAAGAAYVFTRSGSTWTQQAYLKASNAGPDGNFGVSVALSGDTALIGAYGEGSNATGVGGDGADTSAPYSGAAYVFTRSGSTWTQQAYLKASNTGNYDFFGGSVAVSGDIAVVGANSEDSNATGVGGNGTDNSASDSGAAYVFARSGSTWTQQAYLKASNAEANDLFGYSVAVSGETAVIGAFGESGNATGVGGNQADNSATYSGAAYVFTRSGSTWSQQAYLKASNAGAGDFFGYSVAVSGDKAVIGASAEASNASGVGGNQADNSAPGAGAAYVFTRSGSTWSQQSYLKASNTGADDNFGAAVAVSGDTAVIGAYGEASNATIIGGDGADNSASGSGAAYIFSLLGSAVVPVPTVTAISPDRGSTAGGTSVTITGTNFTGATGVTIGGVAAPITSITATEITATTPAGIEGPASVLVTTPLGTNAANALFTYVNTPPVITSNSGGTTAAISIAENTTAVTTVTANDLDAPAQTLSYSLTGGADVAKFSIVPATGVLTFQAAPDFENRADAGSNNVYEVTVTVTDNGTGLLTDSQDISVTVTDVNETPVIARTNATVTVDEGSLAGNTGTFSDPEGNATATLSASVGTVTPNNGAGTWSWAFTPADGPTDNQTVIITANDGVNPAVTTSFSLVVNNVAPVYDLGSPVTLASNVDTYSSTVSFVDPGTDTWSGTVNYGDGSGSGPLSVNGGAKTFALSHVYAVSGTYTVSVTLSDDDGGSLADTVNVTVSLLPVVTTLAADPVKALKATLQGTVNARGLTTTPTFELGTTSGVYTQTIATVPVTVSGSSVTSVSALATGLAQQTTYFYRLTGSSSAGAVQGGELSFTTPEAVPVLRGLALAGSAGTQVPGAPVGTSYSTFFGSPAVGSSATFAVRGQIKRPDNAIQHALFLGTGPQLFLRGQDSGSGPGDAVPASLPGGTYLNFFDPVLNASNQIAFMANTGGAAYASGQRTIFTNIPDGIMKVIARQGATMSGFTFGTPSNVSVAGEGVLFLDSGNTKLYGWEDDQGLQLLFENGKSVSGKTVQAFEFVTGTGYGSAQGRSHVVDSVTGNQKVALSVSFSDGSKGIVKGSIAPDGTLSGFDTAVLMSGEPIDKLNTGAPVIAGAPWGTSLFQKAGWDQSGKYFGFQGFIQGGTYGSTVVNTNSNSALFVDVAPGETILQVREGEQAAGTPAGVTYRDFFELSMGDSPAQYAFYADLRGPTTSTANNIGLWYKNSTGIKLAMRTGSSPHGVGGATVKNITLYGQPAQAGLGVVADLNFDAAVNATNDRGFWAVNSLGQVKLGLREGQLFNTVAGPRTVSSFVILNAGVAANGASRGFSPDGFFTALITFTDSSQIIVEIEVP